MSGGAEPPERPEQRQRVPSPATAPPERPGPSPAPGAAAAGSGGEHRQAAEETRPGRGDGAELGWGDTVLCLPVDPGSPPAAAAPLISFGEALRHFQAAERGVRPRTRGGPPTPPGPARGGGRGLAALLRVLLGPPRLQPQLQAERELALAMARCALDDEEGVHMRILQTIYRRLTRSRLGCPRYGAHWEELGFQGSDPGTDLRGTGMLGLMQILFFVMDSQTLPLAREIFQLSQHETQSFPFCIMSVNITRLVLQALREGRLSRECNRRQEVIAVLNRLYAAAFLQLYRLWKRQGRTLADSASVLRELELSTKKKPKQLLKSLEAYVRGSPGRQPSPPPQEINFTDLCDIQEPPD